MQTRSKKWDNNQEKNVQILFIVVAHIQNIIEIRLIFLLFDCGQLILEKTKTIHYFLFPFEFTRNENRINRDLSQ